MEATEVRCGDACVQQMKLQRARSRIWKLRTFSDGFGQLRVGKGDHVRVQEFTKGISQPSKPLALTATVAAKLFSTAMRLARPGANESCRTNYAV